MLYEYAKFTDPRLERHARFWAELEKTLSAKQLKSISDGGDLRKIWTERPPATAEHKDPQPRLIEDVVYYSQYDSATDQGWRMCFSSSVAMAVQKCKPMFKGPNGDDEYLKIVMNYGDTTEPGAHLKALNSLGIKAKFTERCSSDIVSRQLGWGVPVPVGYLHQGPVSAPTGGGHWCTIIGETDDHWIVHDPGGECRLVSGGLQKGPGYGKEVRYSKKNFNRRWLLKQTPAGLQYTPGWGYAILMQKR